MNRVSIGFAIFILIVLSYAVLEASIHYSIGAAIFPLSLAIPAFVLVLIQLKRELRPQAKSQKESPADFVDLMPDSSIPLDVAYRKAFNMFIWLTGFLLATWLIGFKITTILFFILYMRIEGNIKWSTTLIITCVCCYLLFFHFNKITNVHWPSNLMGSWINWPWLFE